MKRQRGMDKRKKQMGSGERSLNGRGVARCGCAVERESGGCFEMVDGGQQRYPARPSSERAAGGRDTSPARFHLASRSNLER